MASKTRRHHAIALSFLMVFAVSCKTAPMPMLDEDASTNVAPHGGDAASVDSADAGVEAGAAPAVEPTPAPVVQRSERDLEETPPALAKSPVPTSWSDAVEIVIHGHHDCNAVLKREWVKMTCPSSASVALLAGSVDGVMLDIREPPPDPHASDFGQPQRDVTGVAVFPVRRGDRRLFQFNVFHQGVISGYSTSPDSMTPGPVLSEVWLDGDKGPRLEADGP